MRNIAFQSRRETLEAHHAATQREADAAELEYKTAYESGDSDGMIAAQRKMSRAEAASIHTEQMRAELERSAQAYQSSAPADPVEACAQGRTPASAKWIRQHPEFVLDSSKSNKLTAAHYSAMSEGHAPDSSAYFNHIEKFVGLRDGGSAQRGHKRTTNEATVREGAGTLRTKQGDPNTVYLSKREVEIADSLGLSLSEYIRRRRLMDSDPKWQRMDGY
jgi:hypothetical protein